MTDRTSTLKVVVDPSGAEAGSDRVKRALNDVKNTANQTADAIDKSLSGISAGVNKVADSLGFLQKIVKTAFVLDQIMDFGRALYDVNTRVQGFIATMTVVTNSQAASRKEFEFVTQVANKYGVSIDSLTQTYAKLAAAGKDSALTQSDLHKIFEAMAMASNVLHLSMEETRLVFYALQQMVSKGNVSMEELRRQLAEKFPGAVNLMAKALEVPVKELENLIRAGAVASDQALPKFAEEIMKAFGSGSQVAVKSLNAEVNRLHNAWFEMLRVIGESGLLTKVAEIIQFLTKSLNDNQGPAKEIGEALTRMVDITAKWVQSLTAQDIRSFFDTLKNAMDAIVPVAQLIGMIVKGWALLLGPLVKTAAEVAKDFTDNRIISGLEKMVTLFRAGLGDPGAIRKLYDFSAGTEKVAESTNKVVGVIKRAEEANAAYGKSTADQLKDLEAEYAGSLRKIEVKTKERNAVKELASMEAQRAALIRAARDDSLPEQDRISYFRALMATEKEYIGLKKEASEEVRASEAAYKKLMGPIEQYISSLEKERDKLALTTEQLDQKNLATLTAGLRGKQLEEVTKRVTTAQEALNRARKQEELVKAEDELLKTRQKELDTIQKQIEKQKEENDQVGLNKQQIREYEIAKLEAVVASNELKLAVDESSQIGMKEYEVLQKQNEALKKLIELKKSGNYLKTNQEELEKAEKEQKKLEDAWNRHVEHIGNSLTDALLRGFESGKSFAENFRDTLKNMFKTLVLKPIIQPIIQGGVNALAGLFGLGPNGGGGGAFGNILGSIFGGGGEGGGGGGGWGNVISAGANYFLGGAGGTSGVLGGGLAGTIGGAMMGMGGSLGAFGGGLAMAGQVGSIAGAQAGIGMLGAGNIAAGLGAMVPIIGQIVAIAAVLYSVLAKPRGGPKEGGSFFGDFDSYGNYSAVNQRLFTPDTQDKLVGDLGRATGQAYVDAIKRYGGTAGAFTLGLGFDSDPRGTAPNRVSSYAALNGVRVFGSQDRDIGRDNDKIGEELNLEAQRALVAALKASELPSAIADVFKNINVDTATLEQIQAAFAAADELITVIKGLETLDISGLDLDTLKEFQREGETISATFTRVASAWGQFKDLFYSDGEKLDMALAHINKVFADAGVAVPTSVQAFRELVNGLDLTTEAGRTTFAMLMDVAPAFAQTSNAIAQLVSNAQSIAASINPSLGGAFAQQNLRGAVADWMALNPNHQNGWTIDSTIGNIANITSSPGAFNAALAYAQSLGGDALTKFNAMLSAYQATLNNNQAAATTSMSNFTSSVNDATSSLQKMKDDLRDWAVSKSLGSNSPLLPQDKLIMALSEYERALSIGDIGGFRTAADNLIDVSQDYYASGQDAVDIFNRVMSDAQKLGGFNIGYSDKGQLDFAALRADLTTELKLNREESAAIRARVNELIQAVNAAAASGNNATIQAAEQIKQSVLSALDALARK